MGVTCSYSSHPFLCALGIHNALPQRLSEQGHQVNPDTWLSPNINIIFPLKYGHLTNQGCPRFHCSHLHITFMNGIKRQFNSQSINQEDQWLNLFLRRRGYHFALWTLLNWTIITKCWSVILVDQKPWFQSQTFLNMRSAWLLLAPHPVPVVILVPLPPQCSTDILQQGLLLLLRNKVWNDFHISTVLPCSIITV